VDDGVGDFVVLVADANAVEVGDTLGREPDAATVMEGSGRLS